MAMVSDPMSVTAGRAFATWLQGLERGLLELIDEGAAPNFSGLDRFLPICHRLISGVQSAADAASAAGSTRMTIDIAFTDAEMRMLNDFGEMILNYLEVLTVQGKFDATMSPEVLEAMFAIQSVFSNGQVTRRS